MSLKSMPGAFDKSNIRDVILYIITIMHNTSLSWEIATWLARPNNNVQVEV